MIDISMRTILIRHGESVANIENFLSDEKTAVDLHNNGIKSHCIFCLIFPYEKSFKQIKHIYYICLSD